MRVNFFPLFDSLLLPELSTQRSNQIWFAELMIFLLVIKYIYYMYIYYKNRV